MSIQHWRLISPAVLATPIVALPTSITAHTGLATSIAVLVVISIAAIATLIAVEYLHL
jgi:hypothetical protein